MGTSTTLALKRFRREPAITGFDSLSLLLSSHLRIFQHPRVRSFTACYCSFNLLKSRSPPLRVYCPRLGRAVNTRFPFASTAEPFRLATDNNSQTHYAKGKQSPRPFELRQMESSKSEYRISKLQVQSIADPKKCFRISEFVLRICPFGQRPNGRGSYTL